MVINKSKSAFKTIAEVADELGVATHVLRFWETKFNQIHPMKATGGRRFYRPDDVEVLKLIKGLLYNSRYTIERAQQLIKDKGVINLLGNVEIQKHFFAENDKNGQTSESMDLSLNQKTLKDITDAINALKNIRGKLNKS